MIGGLSLLPAFAVRHPVCIHPSCISLSPRWSRVDTIPGGYVVRDANGQALVFVCSRDNDAEARQAKVLTKDEARRIAINIARLPELLGKSGRRLTARRPKTLE